MSNGLIGFMAAAGVMAWVYNKLMNSSGRNTKSSLIVAGVAGFSAFVLTMIALNAIPTPN
jgi:hypothetical protein